MDKTNFKIKYLNKLHTILKNIFDYAVKNYGLNTNPASICGKFQRVNEDIVTDEEKLRYITLDDLKKLIDVIDEIEWKTFFCFSILYWYA